MIRGDKLANVLINACIIFACACPASAVSELLVEEGLSRYQEAVAAQKNGDYNIALSGYQKALLLLSSEKNSRCAIYNNIGIMYAENGDGNTAEAMFAEALRIDPAYKNANFNMGVVCAQKGLCTQALEYWSKCFDLPGVYALDESVQK